MKNSYSTGYSCGYIIRDGHDWGPPSDWISDCAKCRDCGLEASNASITRGSFTHNDAPLPACHSGGSAASKD